MSVRNAQYKVLRVYESGPFQSIVALLIMAVRLQSSRSLEKSNNQRRGRKQRRKESQGCLKDMGRKRGKIEMERNGESLDQKL